MINVTKTYLPDIEKYKAYINEIFHSGQITNYGPLVQKLEKRLEKFLGVRNLILVANGTIALEVAYRALGLKDEVITTPFSFVATTSSLVSCGLNPIFADIDRETFNINVENIEKRITGKTTGIVPVHVFGNPCDVISIQKIADKHGLKVIYDAAHAFGVKSKSNSILNFGEISTLSFHATKIFHTIEGGALIVNNQSLVDDVRAIVNFGIDKKKNISINGTNAKMNEFEAAMGLCLLDELDNVISARRKVYLRYEDSLKDKIFIQRRSKEYSNNYSYFPILLKSEKNLKSIQKRLNELQIFPRRYFYPSLDRLEYLDNYIMQNVSIDVSERILCLPLFHDLDNNTQDLIVDTVLKGNI